MSALTLDRDVSVPTGRAINGSAGSSATLAGTNTLNGVQWPSTAGSTGQVLCLQSSSQAQWANAASGANTYSRQVVTDATHTVLTSAPIVIVKRSAGCTVTLPAVTSATDIYYIVADGSGGISTASPIVIAADGSDTIMGAATYEIRAPYNAVKLVHDGVSLWLLV